MNLNEQKNRISGLEIFQGSVIPNIWQQTVVMMILALVVTFLYVQGNTFLDQPVLASLIPGVVLGLLLVFRTNTAYERFWEGRKVVGGIISMGRALSRQLWVNIPENTALDRANKLAVNHLISAFLVATKLHLRKESVDQKLAMLVTSEQEFQLRNTNHMPLKIIQWIGDYLFRWHQLNYIDSIQLTTYNTLLDRMVEYLGCCERILNTPMPKAYATHLKHLLMIYCSVVPFQLVGKLGWWTVPVTGIICFALLGIEGIGLEIENPFGEDLNDIPLDNLCNRFHSDVEQLHRSANDHLLATGLNNPVSPADLHRLGVEALDDRQNHPILVPHSPNPPVG